MDEAVELGADCRLWWLEDSLKGLTGRPVSKDIASARQMVRDGLAELLEYARAAAMPLAIEPLHPMYAGDLGCVNTMEHANDLCDELGSGIGIAVDVYHVWWDPQLKVQIERAARAGEERILAFHVSDWLVPTTDPANDRGMMGDGVIDIRLIRSWVEAAGYRGGMRWRFFPRRTGGSVMATTCWKPARNGIANTYRVICFLISRDRAGEIFGGKSHRELRLAIDPQLLELLHQSHDRLFHRKALKNWSPPTKPWHRCAPAHRQPVQALQGTAWASAVKLGFTARAASIISCVALTASSMESV